jgi:hypothetical protein
MSAYVAVGWDAITLLSGKNLNQMATQYACAKTFTDVHDHDSAYYTESQIDATNFCNDGLLPDADMIDGKHWDEIIIDFLPVGFICFWDGTRAAIPTGWHECDGSTVNGLDLPDMRGRFPLGAGAVHAALSNGGSDTISNCSGTAALSDCLLSPEQLPVHYHNITDSYNDVLDTFDSGSGSTPTCIYSPGYSETHDTEYNHAAADTSHSHGNKTITLDEFSILPRFICKIAICKVE